MSVEWHEPKARIAGGEERRLRVAPPEAMAVDSSALEAAVQYAESKNSSGLL
jgi:hypothetical protein